MATLRDRHAARIDRLKALVFLIHFVGDLHQPLHAGEKGDAGGNKVNAAYGIYAPPRLNLHSVWDGLLAERAISTPPSIVRRYSAAEKARRSEEHTSELQSLMRISYAVFCLKKKKNHQIT